MDLLKDNSERILAVDFGTKRIGIAISDPLKMFSIPLKTINNNRHFGKELKKIFDEYIIILVVIGNPLREDGTESKLSSPVKKFADELERKFKVNTVMIDERYSSEIAMEHIIQSVPSKKKRRDKSLIDMNAAAVILDDYLKSIG